MPLARSEKFELPTPQIRRLRSPQVYFSSHASFCSHLWSFRQAGHRSGIVTLDSDSNLIVSVVSPVGTAIPTIGQRIMIFGIVCTRTIGSGAELAGTKKKAAV